MRFVCEHCRDSEHCQRADTWCDCQHRDRTDAQRTEQDRKEIDDEGSD